MARRNIGKWVVGIFIGISVATLLVWYGLMGTQTNQSASVVMYNAGDVKSAQTLMTKTASDISKAYVANNKGALANLLGEYTTTVNALAALKPELAAAVTTAQFAVASPSNLDGVQAAMNDYAMRLSQLQTAPLSLANATVINADFYAMSNDIGTIQTALRKH